MAVFAVIPEDGKALGTKIASVIPHGDSLQLAGGAWLVSYPGTSKEVAELLGITEGTPTEGVVLSVSSYWGRATPNIWEWLQSKLK